MVRLLYVNVHGKIYPEKRPPDAPDNGKKRGGDPVAQFQLTDEEAKLSLAELAEKYPPPREKVDEEAG